MNESKDYKVTAIIVSFSKFYLNCPINPKKDGLKIIHIDDNIAFIISRIVGKIYGFLKALI